MHNMTYEAAIKALSELEKSGSVYGTERVRALLARLGSPEKQYRIVHIAGTNGKGSTAAMLDSVLREAGFRTGRFTSPAVFDRRECYAVCGKPASEEALGRAFSEALALRTDTTAFETEFCAAMALFAREKCNYAIVECGLGGRDDATNAIGEKALAIVTSVSLDHTAVLGHTLREIAAHKVGIVGDCPFVTGSQPQEVMEVFAPHHPVVAEPYGGEIALAGGFQRYNAGIVQRAAKLLGVGEEAIARGIARAEVSGRFERIPLRKGVLILDGAHNPGAAIALKEAILSSFPTQERHFIVGAFADKAVDEVMSILLPLAKDCLVLQAPLPRGMERKQLASIASRYCKKVRTGDEAEIRETLSEAGVVIACGSFSILSKVRRCIDG